jgi:hypothetical protein
MHTLGSLICLNLRRSLSLFFITIIANFSLQDINVTGISSTLVLKKKTQALLVGEEEYLEMRQSRAEF